MITTYCKSVLKLPAPTREQTRAFAEYVAGAHSWYKHVKPDLPTRFWFYLRPDAGKSARGEEIIESRHYSGMSTSKWLSRFGNWDYWAARLRRCPHSGQLFEAEPGLGSALVRCDGHGALMHPDFLFYVDMTCHVWGAKFKKPYGKRVGLLDEEEGLSFFDMNPVSPNDYGWRVATRLEVVKKRLLLRKSHQAMLGFLAHRESLAVTVDC